MGHCFLPRGKHSFAPIIVIINRKTGGKRSRGEKKKGVGAASLQAHTRSGSVARPDTAERDKDRRLQGGAAFSPLQHEAVRLSRLRRMEAEDVADGQL